MTIVIHVLASHAEGLHSVCIDGWAGIDDKVMLLGSIDAAFGFRGCYLRGSRVFSG